MRAAVVTGLALLTGSTLLAGCGNDRTGEQQAPSAAPQSLTVAVRSQPTTFDPALATTQSARAVAVAVHTPLLTYRRTSDADAADLVPALAQALPTLSEDGLQYTFNLRPGLLYSDGRLVKASDVERSIAHASKTAADPQLRSALRSIQGAPSRDGQTLTGVRSDDRTGAVVVVLKHGDGRIPLALADPATAPLPELPGSGTAEDDLPASTGPLRIARVTTSTVELVANPLRARISTVPAAGVAQITLTGKQPTSSDIQRGVVDVNLAPGQEPVPKGAAPDTATTALIASLLVPATGLFADRPVRRALAAAIDRRALPATVSPACGLLPDYVVGAVVRQPCPAAPTRPRSTQLAEQVVRIAVPRAPGHSTAQAATPVVLDAMRELGATALTVQTADPAAAVADGRADAALVEADPALPHPADYLAAAASIDDLVAREMPGQTAKPLTGSSRHWADFEKRAVDRPIQIPIAAGQTVVVVGSSVDRRSVVLHPVLGPDLAALTLR